MIVSDYILENQDEEISFEQLYSTGDSYGVLEVFEESELDEDTETLRVPGDMIDNSFRRNKRKLQDFVYDWKSETAYEAGRKSSQQDRIRVSEDQNLESLEEGIDEADKWVQGSNYAVGGSLAGVAFLPSISMKLASGIGGLGAAILGDYERGERDEKIEQAVDGLAEAYGDYSVEIDPDLEYSGPESISEEVKEILSGSVE